MEWWQYDPTKMVIYAMSLFGFAYNLKQVRAHERNIAVARVLIAFRRGYLRIARHHRQPLTSSIARLLFPRLQFPRNEIIKGQLQMQQKKLEAEKRILNWGGLGWAWRGDGTVRSIVAKLRCARLPLCSLPLPLSIRHHYLLLFITAGPDPSSLKAISRSQFDESIKKGAQWVIIDGFVCDVTKFTADHPGGSHLIKPRIGKDISTGECLSCRVFVVNIRPSLRLARQTVRAVVRSCAFHSIPL